MRNAWFYVVLISLSLTAHANMTRGFSDNETISIDLSKTNYNRLLVPNDTITKVRVPPDTFAVDYDADGSVYLDILRDEPITVFVSTKAGHSFSMTVNPVESLGQTVLFTPKTATIQAQTFEKKTPVDEAVTKLIQSMMNNQIPAGYGSKSVFSSYRTFNKDLTFQVSKQFVGDAYVGEVVTLYNRSNKPVTLDETWFKNEDTRAIALSKPTIASKGSETVYLVKETRRA